MHTLDDISKHSEDAPGQLPTLMDRGMSLRVKKTLLDFQSMILAKRETLTQKCLV